MSSAGVSRVGIRKTRIAWSGLCGATRHDWSSRRRDAFGVAPVPEWGAASLKSTFHRRKIGFVGVPWLKLPPYEVVSVGFQARSPGPRRSTAFAQVLSGWTALSAPCSAEMLIGFATPGGKSVSVNTRPRHMRAMSVNCSAGKWLVIDPINTLPSGLTDRFAETGGLFGSIGAVHCAENALVVQTWIG